MDYLFFFSTSTFILDFSGLLSILVSVVFFFKLLSINAAYVAFIVFLLFVYTGLLLLWQGFTLSFLIISIIYSTVFVIFWIFFISFGDLGEKRESGVVGS